MVEDWEGCLSIPDIRGQGAAGAPDRRAGLDRRGKRFEMQASGFTARDPARDRSSRRRAVLRSDDVVRDADVPRRVRPLLVGARRDAVREDRSRAADRDRRGPFTREERARLAPFFTNLDGHVFALTNLPETVKGALFARYSRSAKSLRRLFLDEFAGQGGDGRRRRRKPIARRRARAPSGFTRACSTTTATTRWRSSAARTSRARCVSNVLTKVLEWGRLMAYLEQSTRYVPYTDRLHGRWRYHVPAELDGRRAARPYVAHDGCRVRDATRSGSRAMQEYFAARHPARRQRLRSRASRAIRAKALDTLRGLLPAATQSNVGMFGSGQAFERCCCACARIRCSKARACADEMLAELRKVIPAFLTRVDQPDRGGRWSSSISPTRASHGARRRDAAARRRARRARRSHAVGLRSGRRGQGRRRGALRLVCAARRSAAGDRRGR